MISFHLQIVPTCHDLQVIFTILNNLGNTEQWDYFQINSIIVLKFQGFCLLVFLPDTNCLTSDESGASLK